ncbi:MAG: hypothetical protein LBL47_03595, partial [Lactobacillus sp.]|nr:hypothetical protein [Lactobacillus sp.]
MKSKFWSKLNIFKWYKNLSLKKKIIYPLIVVLLAAAAVAAVCLRKEKIYVEGSIRTPGLSYIYSDRLAPNPVHINFPAPVASMELVGKELDNTQISIFPNVAGKWVWASQYALTFAPESDWAPNTTYTVKINKSALDKNVDVKPLEYKFTTLPFSAEIISKAFYEDPTNPKIKNITFSLRFSHPVDVDDLQNQLKLKTVGGDVYGFKLTPVQYDRLVYVVSDPIQIKGEEDFLNISLKNVKNKYNNQSLAQEAKDKITIPSSSTFFKLNNVSTSIIRNEEKENRPEQILFVEFSTSVSAENLANYLDLYHYNGYCSDFNSELSKQKESDVNVPAIKNISALEHEVLPLENSHSKMHTFKYDIPQTDKKCVVAVVKRGLLSEDGFVFNKTEVRTTSPSAYPTETNIGFDGAIISMAADKRLSVVTRGIKRVEVNIARIPAHAVNHLISQSYGSFSNPYFNSYFSSDNIAENFTEKLQLNAGHPAEINYSSVNLNKYFEARKGIFIAEVKGFRKGQSYASNSDKRLIMVSDLGLIVKDNIDNSHEVLVSSFNKGEPVNNAKVEILGKNGIPVLSVYTDRNGLASVPDFKDFKKEKQPVAYIVSKGEDFSYMPLNKSDRKLDYSRFDTSGVYDYSSEDKISAFVFNDRGIYRPGEDAFFGIIVRNTSLEIPENNTIKVEVYNAHGDEVLEKTMKVSEYGLMDIKYSIDKMAKTGQYYMNVSVLKDKNYYTSIGTNYFTVEEFTPDTMKIKSKIEQETSSGWITENKLDAVVTLENLYGNPAMDHTVKASFTLNPTTFYFNKYKDFTFMDPMRNSSQSPISINERLDEQQTNDKGNAPFEIDLSGYVKGTYRLTFYAQGMEKEGGRSVSTSSSVMVSPVQVLVGFKKDGSFNYINKDAERKVEFIAINPTLEQIDLSNVTLELYETVYVSTLIKQPNGTFKYQSVPKENMLSATKININRGGYEHALDTSKPGEYYIQVMNDKGELVSKVSYMVAGAKNLTYSLEKNAELKLKLNKGQYNHGDNIEMQVTAPYTGYGLITIEKDKVYARKWFKADTLASTQTIKLPYNVEGNAYVNVAFIRDLKSKEIFMSPLSYAVAPFDINKEKRTINIELDVPTVVKPGESLNINYKASENGKIIIYGVNEGILQVSKYQTPKPLAFFMPKKALRVITSQIMDLILPDAGIVNRLRSTGGDEMSEESLAAFANPFARKVDKPVAFWSGIIDVDVYGKTYSYDVPENFNGQIRVMAVSVDKYAYGVTQKTALVRGDFAMTLSAPFNVSPDDVFEAGISLTNMVEGSKNLPVTLKIMASDNLEVMDKEPEVFDLKERKENSFKFRVKAKDPLGDATLQFVASSGEYRSKMTIHTGIRPAMPYTTNIEAGMGKKSQEFKDFSINMFNEYQNKEVFASSSPLVLAKGLVKYLEKYPYTCTEQTVSRIYPMVALLFQHPHLVDGIDVYAVYDEAIARLKLRQGNDGGFSFWGNSSSNPELSMYSLQFLQYAKSKGFSVPSNMMSRAVSYAKEVAARTPSDLYESQSIAYAIYVLTNGGEVTTNYLINLENHLDENHAKEWKKTLTASYVAASYKLLKNDDKANAIVGYYKPEHGGNDDYRHIYLMANHFEKEFNKIKDKGVELLLEPLKTNSMNSYSSALSIMALTS